LESDARPLWFFLASPGRWAFSQPRISNPWIFYPWIFYPWISNPRLQIRACKSAPANPRLQIRA